MILISDWQVLLGDMGAGKSSLVLRFVKGQFLEFQVVYMNFDYDEFVLIRVFGSYY